ncbi:hypothetical protein [Carnobacterium inhibens]|uniref:Uncharacterized protein n=1 Tax=Carnobacterium inhibens subsp. gilichinskyi TaxID=1266845 RepID=U5SG52_9LACT|nr:hypothetical protein [Carnobacterium inhibens]AGY82862.1 hypothetical protein Q783_09190 [Carnobacterium inhibens subsp. gilichinskyi]
MNDYLILKLSDKDLDIPFSNEKALTERANGSWVITPRKIGKTNRALLLFKGQILKEYSVGSVLIFDRDSRRTTFDMTPLENSIYQGRRLRYPTANPSSILSEKNMIFIDPEVV